MYLCVSLRYFWHSNSTIRWLKNMKDFSSYWVITNSHEAYERKCSFAVSSLLEWFTYLYYLGSADQKRIDLVFFSENIEQYCIPAHLNLYEWHSYCSAFPHKSRTISSLCVYFFSDATREGYSVICRKEKEGVCLRAQNRERKRRRKTGYINVLLSTRRMMSIELYRCESKHLVIRALFFIFFRYHPSTRKWRISK